MDPFLRRVVEQREREQEAAILDLDLAREYCQGCDKALQLLDDPEPRHFCTDCGGRKADRRYEQAQAAKRARELYVGALLELINFPKGSTMDRKICTRCGRGLRADNTKGVCSRPCAVATSDEGTSAGPAVLDTYKASLRRFKALTEALGVDGDELLQTFMDGWISRVRTSAVPHLSDE